MHARLITAFFTAVLLILQVQPLMAAHKLQEETCYDCHAVGGAKDMIIQGTNLIKKDARMVEIINGGWSSGHLPCTFCHDDSTIRTNKIGVKNHFTDYSLSKHPVDPYLSNTPVGDGISTTLDCVDCHTNVTYVTGGANPLNPNIHGLDTSSVGWTSNSQLVAAGTSWSLLTTATATLCAGHVTIPPIRHPFSLPIFTSTAPHPPESSRWRGPHLQPQFRGV
jgi:hypothetical protein